MECSTFSALCSRSSALLLLLLLSVACGPGAEVSNGRELYLAYGCAACHGERADGNGPAAANAFVRPRDLRNLKAFRGPKTVEGIANLIAFGVADGRTGMPAYPDIPKRERTAIAEYIVSLANEPRGVIASEAWSGESNPAWNTAATYLTLTNAADRAIALTGVTTSAAKKVELHEMKQENGMMAMRQLDRIVIAPGETRKLSPGGTHLMLIDTTRTLRDGETISLTLQFDDGSLQTLNAAVRANSAHTATVASPAQQPPRPKTVPEFTLVDHNGHAFRSTSLRGRPALLFFGYTHCPDACPTMMSRLARAYREAGTDARDIPTLFVSVDPRDTPAILKQYLGYFAAVPARGLTGSRAQIDHVVAEFGGKYEIRGSLVEHTLWIYLLDRNGRIVETFDPSTEPAKMAEAMRRYASGR
jgi:cytochrome oxidase Cu insertion factor (SCO1/SenC/PrrC family)/mono/diheme cytochrome c family protein